jgi:hypothetical protein
MIVKPFDPDGEDEASPHARMIISLLKRWLLGTHQGAVQEVHLQAYLDEYTFRFNRLKQQNPVCYSTDYWKMQCKPMTRDELLGHTSKFLATDL